MDSSLKFILQGIKILTETNYNDSDLTKIYQFFISIDNEKMLEFRKTHNIMSYSNDLELYVDSVSRLIKVFEEKEKYEECHDLMKKIKESEKILNEKTTK